MSVRTETNYVVLCTLILSQSLTKQLHAEGVKLVSKLATMLITCVTVWKN